MASPATVNVNCPGCRQLMAVPATGGTFQCPTCRMQMSVPAQQVAPVVDPAVSIFQVVDKDRSGQISTSELQSALSQGGWRPFSRRVIRMMISMFDADGSGQISMDEFKRLWKYLNDWKACFQSFDTDRSGSIEVGELTTALSSFGYRFSPPFFAALMAAYDGDKTGNVGFDEFIEMCFELQIYGQHFNALDTSRTGSVTMTFEQFLVLSYKPGK